MDPELTVTDQPDDETQRQLIDNVVAFNTTRAGPEDWRPLAVWLREDGTLIAGASGRTHWDWMFVSHLWVAENHRGTGLGRRLMTTMETEARSRGCRAGWVDTYSFQAPRFYATLGYQEFGRLDQYPPGSSRHFMWKPLGGD